MPVDITRGNDIPNYFGAPSKPQRTSAQQIIAQLQYADI
jgi:hypothetical protein